MKATWSLIRRYFPILVIAGAFAWSAISIVTYRRKIEPPGTITIRIAHWQLEAGVRDGFDLLAREYRKLHPNVVVVQDAIPEMVYGQWVSTQLMGGTGPDLLEVGMGLPPPIWIAYASRYFVPITDIVSKPNPYNADNELAGMALRQTMPDSMRSGYVDELQNFMYFPLSLFGLRIYYNKDLLRKLTGRTEPPTEYADFIDVCKRIRSQKDPETGQDYTAIACSKLHIVHWETMMADQLTFPALRYVDFNRDGFVGNDEQYVGFKTGRVSLKSPFYEARFRMMRDLCDNFQRGFTGVSRDEAVFLFAQQRAMFITTGSWDAKSLIEQAGGQFEVGIMDFPVPAKDDPVFGKIMEGPRYERLWNAFPFAVVKTSKHPEVAIDFMLFLLSKKMNQKLNDTIGWIPAVKGTKTDPLLEAFRPKLEGVFACWQPILGGETNIRYMQDYSLFQVGQITYDQFVERFQPFYIKLGMKDFMEQQREWRRGMHNTEQFLAGIRAPAMLADQGTTETQLKWQKYQNLVAWRQVGPEIGHNLQMRLMEKGPDIKGVAPYEYTSDTLARVRERLAGKGAR